MLLLHKRPQTSQQRPRGCALSDIPSDIRTAAGHRPHDFVSDDRPAGHYSVYEFLARTEPELFRGLIDAEEAFADVSAAASALAGAEGVAVLDWPAPLALWAAGIRTVLIFPNAILRDAIPRNP